MSGKWRYADRMEPAHLMRAAAFAALASALSFSSSSHIAEAAEPSARPRFVSLAADAVNMREGPSTEHRIRWVYHREGLPVQIIAEYDVWRRVRDMDGEVGWVHVALLANRRTAIVTGDGLAPVLSRDNQDSSVIAEAEPGVTANVESCGPIFCRLDFASVEGWVDRSRLWGIYADEHF